mmetsp:Transcript_29242/g.61692  ORF Transcript_29242/g.61692 Transcript_29242/m.61692 type:complete len:302 (-) Transcript_29242:1082-1987(-)
MPKIQANTDDKGADNNSEGTRLLVASLMLSFAQNASKNKLESTGLESESTTSESTASQSDGNASDSNNRRCERESNSNDSDNRRSETGSKTPSDRDCDAGQGLKRMIKSVSFSPNVRMRYTFCSNHPQLAGDTVSNAHNTSLMPFGWFHRDEFTSVKTHGKYLSEGNLRALQTNILEETTNFDATHLGMEHFTDFISGRKRRRVREEAIQATMQEQKRQLIDRVIEAFTAPNASDSQIIHHQVKKKALRMDNHKLAVLYKDKSKDALLRAMRTGEEDAEVAAAILAQDMNQFFNTTSRSCL